MEWIKQIPNWVKGAIGFLTAIIGFVLLFLNNIYLSVTVSVVILLVSAFLFSLYVAFSKVRSETTQGAYEYRFPEHRQKALAGLFLIPLLSVILIASQKTRSFAIIAFTGTATPSSKSIELISENFQGDLMLYDVIVQNNSNVQQVLIRIGSMSNLIGNYSCIPLFGGGSPLISSGNYIVRFNIDEPETVKMMEPPLSIPPHDVVRFTVTLLPESNPGCSSWTSDIALFVENAAGERVQSDFHTVKQSDLRALIASNYSVEELLTIAGNSSDAITRATALEALIYRHIPSQATPAGMLDPAALRSLFLNSLQDISPPVRSVAIYGLTTLASKEAVPQIILVLQNDEDSGVRSYAARVLGDWADRRAVGPLATALKDDPSEQVKSAAARALGEIGDSQAETALIEAWENSPSPDLVTFIVDSLIKLKSTKAIPLIITELQKQGEDEYRLRLVSSIAQNGGPSYFSAFVPTLVDLLANDKSIVFRRSLAFYADLAPTDPEVVSALGRSAMQDPAPDVQLTAVDTLRRIGSTAAIEQLKQIAASQTGAVKSAAEEALQSLEQVP